MSRPTSMSLHSWAARGCGLVLQWPRYVWRRLCGCDVILGRTEKSPGRHSNQNPPRRHGDTEKDQNQYSPQRRRATTKNLIAADCADEVLIKTIWPRMNANAHESKNGQRKSVTEAFRQ